MGGKNSTTDQRTGRRGQRFSSLQFRMKIMDFIQGKRILPIGLGLNVLYSIGSRLGMWTMPNSILIAWILKMRKALILGFSLVPIAACQSPRS
jgi:hypothetical protein